MVVLEPDSRRSMYELVYVSILLWWCWNYRDGSGHHRVVCFNPTMVVLELMTQPVSSSDSTFQSYYGGAGTVVSTRSAYFLAVSILLWWCWNPQRPPSRRCRDGFNPTMVVLELDKVLTNIKGPDVSILLWWCWNFFNGVPISGLCCFNPTMVVLEPFGARNPCQIWSFQSYYGGAGTQYRSPGQPRHSVFQSYYGGAGTRTHPGSSRPYCRFNPTMVVLERHHDDYREGDEGFNPTMVVLEPRLRLGRTLLVVFQSYYGGAGTLERQICCPSNQSFQSYYGGAGTDTAVCVAAS